MNNRHLKIGATMLTLALATAFWRPWTADALVSGSPCPGNVCAGSVVVGGQTVTYEYTQHVGPSGQFRLRLNGGSYSTTQMVSYIVSGLPAFNAWGKFANPVGGAIYLPDEDVNPGRTAYERRAGSGLSSQIVDQVMTVTYAAAAPGQYSFNLTVIQNGESGGDNDLIFYIDAGAPGNDDESAAWSAVPGMDLPCADGVDNDLDYRADCADAQCAGRVGEAGSGALCQSPETTCNDGFDNDADGRKDCLDPDCNGRVGQPLGTARCQYPDESGAASCNDGFDNDADGQPDCYDNTASDGNPAHACWKQEAFGCPAKEDCATAADDDKDRSYSDAYDAVASTGANCLDYDCRGNAACPSSEDKTPDGTPADGQCFDGLDNDLDGLFDCHDPNCVGKTNPFNSSQRCYDSEFSLVNHYQMCANGFDDDGDVPRDCADSDCAAMFGNCGPCPSREDYTLNSCADGQDNDADGLADCSDVTNCVGKLGRLTGAAYCAAAENTADLCMDGFDNDHDGLTDCADPGCAGLSGPTSQVCQSIETACDDGLDNDTDGRIDCGDASCYGLGGCAAKTYADAPCQVVPSYVGPMAFTGNDPTVLATVTGKNHVNATDSLRFTGSASYSSVVLIVGDNTTSANYYPYADPAACQLVDTATGAPAASFAMTAIVGHAVQVYNTAATVSGFDVTLKCPTTGEPTAARSYPISLSALKQPGSEAEYGDATFSTTLLEATAPTVSEVEAEAVRAGVVRVPYRGAAVPEGRRLRAVAEDPGVAPYSSGICHCDVGVAGTGYDQTYATLADCYTPSLGFVKDDMVTVRGRAEDGAGNTGAWSSAQSYAINVTPVVADGLTMSSASPFISDVASDRRLYARFLTGESDSFVNDCKVYLRTAAGSIVNGPVGPTFTFSSPFGAVGNELICDTQTAVSLASRLPAGLADGTYFLTVAATDGDGDSVETARRPLIICNSVPAAGDPESVCSYADFDGDGAADGLYTTLYSDEPRACDNCVGLPNSDQADANANGIGDACEPTKVFGRCEVDREVVCECDSDQDCDYPCPFEPHDKTPAVPLEDPTKQQCKTSWGICTYEGQVCFGDGDCPGPQGVCQADGATVCRRDTDCQGDAAGRCVGNPDPPDVCDNMLTPWFQSRYGNIFSRSKIFAPEMPPEGQFNATYCIIARDVISNFSSELCDARTDDTARYTFPKRSNLYSTVLGRLDIDGLRAGKYGTVTELAAGTDVGAVINALGGHLAGRVFRVTGDATMSAVTLYNDAVNGAGTVLVDGGNLTVTGNVAYDETPAATLRGLASLGVIVLDTDPASTKGTVYISGSVTRLSGSYYAEGQDGIWSVAPPATDSRNQLNVYGLMMANKFHFNRSYKSMTEGAERVTYDGRAVANPPPGFGDLGKALPRFTDTSQ